MIKRIINYILLLIIIACSTTKQNNIDNNTNIISNNIANKEIKYISNEAIWRNYEFYSGGVSNIKNIQNTDDYSNIDEQGNLNRYSYNSDEIIDKYFNINELTNNKINMSDYEININLNKILISSDEENIYRRSSKSHYYIYDIKSHKIDKLDDDINTKQSLATFSKNGKYIVYVKDNNIYYKDIISNKIVKITKDGQKNKIINGTTDWVYEEEFAITQGFYMSDDNKNIVYYKFDESEVKDFHLDFYNELYPTKYEYKYPKAGEDNSKISIWLYNIETGKTNEIKIEGNDYYLPRLKWINTDEFLITKLNRLQNNLELIKVNSHNFEQKVIYTEKSNTYIDIYDYIEQINDNEFLFLSEKDDYLHIYKLNINGKIEAVTTGNWDIIEVYGYNKSNNCIYFSSAEISPIYSHIYKININDKVKTKLTNKNGSNTANFSNNMNYFVLNYSSVTEPNINYLCNQDGVIMKQMTENVKAKNNLKKYDIPKIEFIQIPNTNGDNLNAYIIYPINFDSNQKYPLFMTGYNGPGHNTVEDSWSYSDKMWHSLLAQKGYIVVSVDTRGTMNRGRKFKHSTYLQLGKYETQDLIDCAKYLGYKNYIDEKRIGIQGWSFGGYMSSLCISKGADVFKLAIAVAPVTNWRYYDNIYTERFMRTPIENAKGYDDNSPINFVDKIKGKYLLIHGLTDDNVHPQNSFEMINSLVKNNKQFDLMIYPNRNHGIYGGNTRLHLYDYMTNYILNNL